MKRRLHHPRRDTSQQDQQDDDLMQPQPHRRHDHDLQSRGQQQRRGEPDAIAQADAIGRGPRGQQHHHRRDHPREQRRTLAGQLQVTISHQQIDVWLIELVGNVIDDDHDHRKSKQPGQRSVGQLADTSTELADKAAPEHRFLEPRRRLHETQGYCQCRERSQQGQPVGEVQLPRCRKPAAQRRDRPAKHGVPVRLGLAGRVFVSSAQPVQ